MHVNEMRAKLSVKYGGGWKDRLDKMTDHQVFAIFQRHLNEQRMKEKN